MNIALFTDTYFPDANGVSVTLKHTRRLLIEQGHNVYVVAPNHRLKTIFQKEEKILLCSGIPMKRWGDIKAYFSLSPEIKKIITSWDLDIIHIHSEYGIAHLGLKIARKNQIPMIYHAHTFWDRYVNASHLPTLIKKPVIQFVYSVMNKFISHAEYVLTPSLEAAKWLQTIAPKTEHNKINVIKNNIDLDLNQKLSEKEKKLIADIKKEYEIDNYFVCGHLGRIVNEKNSLELMKFMYKFLTKYPDLKLKFFVVGGGTLFSKCQKYISDLGVNNKIILVGMVKPFMVKYYYHCFDMFTSNSSSETEGLTYYEAASCSLPLSVRFDSVLLSILHENENGHFFKDYSQFEKNILTMYQLKNKKPDIFQQMQQKSKEISQQSRQENSIPKLISLYQKAQRNYKK